MQKKLLAVAVAGALAAPAAAMAQSSVTISGAINMWYEQAGATGATNTQSTSGASPTTYDIRNRDRMQDATGSNIRFTAVEDIGSGLQGFMQVESAVMGNANTRPDAAGQNQTTTGWGTRNSGVGLRGQAWGEVLIGVWDIHYNEHWVVDNQIIKGATHTVSNGLNGTVNNFAGIGIGGRSSNVIRYQSPNWGGFDFKLVYARPSDGAVSTTPGVADGTKNKAFAFSPRWSNGPIVVGFSYLQDKDLAVPAASLAIYSGATMTNSATSTAVTTVGGSSNVATVTSQRLYGGYTFPFGLKLGLVYDSSKIKMKSSTSATSTIPESELKRAVWTLPISWNTGAHTIFASYSQADKTKGSLGTGNGTSVDLSNLVVTPAGSTSAAGDVSSNSKAKMYVLGYQFDLSKRTNMHVSYTQIKNDALASYDTFSNTTGMTASSFGADPRIISLGLRHAF
jgi:predicted porin